MDDCGYRVKITNLPHFLGPRNVKKFLKSRLDELTFRKLNFSASVAFITFDTENDANAAVELLNSVEFKKNKLEAKRVANKSMTPKENDKNFLVENPRTANQLVTPLADMAYTDQLELKNAESKKLMNKLKREMRQANIFDLRDTVLHEILPSPSIEGYRNKCEFTVGYTNDNCTSDNIVVGFICGKMANRECQVMPVGDCLNLSQNTKFIVYQFQMLVRQFGQEPFNEFKREGFWKMLTVKDFCSDSMIIVTVYPPSEREISNRAKKALVDCFCPFEISKNNNSFKFNVTSIYWLEQANTSDVQHFEHIAGASYIYESLLGVSFRISPSTFFQTNTRAAGVLYTKIGDLLDLPKIDCVHINNMENDDLNEDIEDCSTSSSKKIKLELENESQQQNMILDQQRPIVILDICCGAGSISLCLLKRLKTAMKLGYCASIPCGTIGVELNVEAVRDAKRNTFENGFDSKSCVYICGQAEVIFKDLQYHMPAECALERANIMGIVDPPRAGVSDKVIIGCRKLIQLKCLIYVSCDPKSAMKNICELCRPTSRKYEGEPFRVVSIHPVDMFPLTEHFEWIVELRR